MFFIYNVIDFSVKGDFRGNLVAIEEMREIPFKIKRIYYIFNTNRDVIRGCHAHKILKQVLICVEGSCKLRLDNGKEECIVQMNNPAKGILLEGLVWREMFDFSTNCVLLVLTDEYYDENDYIRSYDKFLEMVSN